MFDPTAFSLSDTLRCGSSLRRSAECAATLSEAGSAIIDELRDRFVDPATGGPSFVLARMFVTRRFDRLDARLQQYARDQLPGHEFQPDVKCLTLLASQGDLPEWCDVTRSAAHRVIPLPSREVVERTPMIAALLEDLGLNVDTLVSGRPAKGRGDRAGFGVFHVADVRGAEKVPDQEFVTRHGIRSALGFGGLLTADDFFAVVVFSRNPIPASTANLFRTVAVHTRIGLIGHEQPQRRNVSSLRFEVAALRELLEVHEATAAEQAERLERTAAERGAAERRARDEAEVVETLYEIGTALSAELELDRVVQLATHAGRRVTGATWGVFYDRPDQERVRPVAHSASAGSWDAFDDFPVPRAVFEPTLRAAAVFRSADVVRGAKRPDSPIHSYLAVPVLSRTGEVLGAFAFGHAEPGMFDERHERLAVGIAAQAAIAVDNARLYREQHYAAVELQRSLLPELPVVAGLQVISRYHPAARGFDVGGDWLDLIPIDHDHTALVVGDVMGRGLRAAALMGQLRTAIRAYTVMGLSPGVIMYHLNELIDTIPGDQVATCLYAIHDAHSHTLRFANAGHPPPLMVNDDGQMAFLADRLGPLLSGIGTGPYREREITFAPGCGLVLYTDGLVESRKRTVTEGMDELAERLRATSGTMAIYDQGFWDELIDHLANIGAHEDDIAVLYAHT